MCENYILTGKIIEEYRTKLLEEERSAGTVSKYMRDIQTFFAFLPDDRLVNKEVVIAYKKYLSENYKGSSANSMLVALNGLLGFVGWNDCKVKLLRIQRQNFRSSDRELTKEEYQRLLRAAKSCSNERLYLLMQAICSTGIRVSEHRFITVQSLKDGVIHVSNKGKERVVFIPGKLIKPLQDYCRRHGISSGPVFVTRSGRPLDRSNIWSAMKKLGQDAGVDARKIYPHNLRHLFAITYYQLERDIIHLADVLGHSSVETTRIYTATSTREQQRVLSRLGLVGCTG